MSIKSGVNIDKADILIVDDESANLKLLSDILGREGFHVRPANSPKLAIDSALGTPPDLILLDIRMPDMDGFEVCEILKRDERTRDIPVLFISALQDTRDKVRGFEAGAVDFITKPIQEEEVLARVRTHLKLYTMQRRLEEMVAERTAELTKSELLARTLLNATTDLTHLIDEDGTILDLNNAMAARLGASREELIGTCVYDLFSKEAAGDRRKVAQQALVDLKPMRYTDRNSPGKVYDTGVYPIETPAGQKGRIVIYIHDITEQEEYNRNLREREAALQQKVEQMRTIIDTTPAYIFAKDIDGRFLLANKAVADVFGVEDPEQVFGKTDFDYGATEEQTRIYNMIDRSVIASQESLLVPEEQILRKDGTLGWFQTTKVPYQHPGYDKPAILGVAVEITERKEAEQALKESEGRFRATFEQAAVGIAHVGPDGRFLRINKRFCAIIGYDEAEALEKKFQDITHPDDLEIDVKHLDRLIRGEGQTYTIEKRYIRKDATTVWCSLTVSSVRDEDNLVKWFVAVVQDISERKQAEQELQKNRDYLNYLTSSIPDVIFSVKLPERTLEWAKDSFNVLGYDLEEYIGKTTEWLYPSIEGHQNFGKMIEKAILEGKNSLLAEIEVLNRKSDILHAEINATIFRIEGEPVSMIGLIRDISKRKQAEKQLELVKKTIDVSLDSAYWAKEDGSLVYVNDASSQNLGYSKDELLQMSVFEVDSRVTNETWRETLKNLREEKMFLRESVHRRKDGSEFPVEISSILMEFDGNLYVNGFARDISDRKQAEEILKISERRLRKAQEIAHLGIWSFDMVKNQLSWSDEMYRIYGLERGTFVSFDSLLDMVHPDDREYRKKLMADLFDGKKVPSFSYRILRPDGYVRYIYGLAVMEHDEQGNPVRIEGTLQDVTEIKTVEMAYRDSETRLKQAQAETMNLRLEMAHLNRIMTMNELAASFAHELNQPLGAITNNATVARILIARYGEEIEDLDEILNDIADDAQRAGSIIRKIRGVMTKGDAVFSALDLNQLLDEVIALYQNTFNLNHVSIVVEKDPGLDPVKGDQIRLQQVLMNLITNGMDAMLDSSQKVLAFKTLKGESVATVSISDTGRGIDTSSIDHIFDPFYTTKREGMGIGLRLCKSIIDEHGGRIWAENNRDSGTTFTFTVKAIPGGQDHELV